MVVNQRVLVANCPKPATKNQDDFLMYFIAMSHNGHLTTNNCSEQVTF